jgi:hypothetical protein
LTVAQWLNWYKVLLLLKCVMSMMCLVFKFHRLFWKPLNVISTPFVWLIRIWFAGLCSLAAYLSF